MMIRRVQSLYRHGLARTSRSLANLSPPRRAHSNLHSPNHDTSASADSVTTLPDGRKLSFARYGATNGYPIFYFHGFPGSRLEARVFASAACKLDANLISIDRPGIGLSSPQPGRTPLDFARDVQHLAKQLDLREWKILGISGGGGAYSLACALLHPHSSLKGISIACGHLWLDEIGTRGMNLGNKFIYYACRNVPGFLRWIVRVSVSRQFALPDEKLLEISKKKLAIKSGKAPIKDQAALADGSLMAHLIPSAREHFRQGYDAFVEEGRVLTKSDLGFRLEDIKFSPLVLWYGRQDKNVPLAIGEAISKRIASRPELKVMDETHMSLIVNHKERILEELLARN